MPEQEFCECGQEMTFVEDGDEPPHFGSSRIIMPLASDIWECPDHGLWRIYISGARERVERQRPQE